MLLCYLNSSQSINFSQASIIRIKLGSDYLLPVIYKELTLKMGPIKAGMRLPILMYPKDGFLAESLAHMFLPSIFRDYPARLVGESVFYESLKEMVLGSMGIA